MPAFYVLVKRDAYALGPSPFDFEVQSQNSAHAAACGLSLAGGGFADRIEVTALQPRPGRSVQMIYSRCSQGVYGFAYGSRSSGGAHKGVMPR